MTASASYSSNDTVKIDVELSVDDPSALREYAETLMADAQTAHLIDVIAAGVVNPAKSPLDSGFEIVNTKVEHLGADRFMLSVTSRIHDEEAVQAAASSAYHENWGEDPNDLTLPVALYEILVASNSNPSPADIGFSIITGPDVSAKKAPRP